MKEQLRLLVELQKIDTRTYQLKKEKEKIPVMVDAMKGAYLKCRAELEAAQNNLASLEKDKQVKEARLKDDTELLERLKGRLAEIKTNKEYFAHLKEVETVDKHNKELEDAIISLMEQIETATAGTAEVETRFAEEEKKLATERARIEESFAAVDAELAELAAMRARDSAESDPDIFAMYDQMVQTRQGLAVVEAVNYSCMGCHMSLPPQVFNNVRLNKEIITCHNCHRILYWKEGLLEATPS